MKSKLLLLFFLFIFSGLYVSAQDARNLIAVWKGSYTESDVGSTATALAEVKLEKLIGQYIYGELNVTNFSNGKKDISEPIKCFYSQEVSVKNNAELMTAEYVHLIKNINKKVKGQLAFMVTSNQGRRSMTAVFYAEEEKYKKSTVKMVLETQTAELIAKHPNAVGANTGVPKEQRSAANSKVIHLSANPVQVEGNQLFAFNDGYAVVKKGSSFCLIDNSGKTVIPYNRYNFLFNHYAFQPKTNRFYRQGMPISDYGFIKGILVVQDLQTKLWGAFNNRLNLVVPCKYADIDEISDDGYIRATTNNPVISNRTKILFDQQGKIIATSPKPIGQMALTPAEFGYTNKAGFVDYLGNFKIKPDFERTRPFSEGLAAVAKNDQFGILKWGFINTKAEVVIPFIYSNLPGDFHNGLALVEPAVKDDLDFAYIDRKGNIAIKIKDGPGEHLSPSRVGLINNTWAVRELGAFSDGSALWYRSFRNTSVNAGMLVMDTAGKTVLFQHLLTKNGWPLNTYTTQSEFVNNEILISSRSGVKYDEIHAIVNIKGEIIITTSYQEGLASGWIYSLFDPVSGLAQVTKYDDKRTIEGYSDRNGEIKIILAPPAKW